jgi:hypothetical protein
MTAFYKIMPSMADLKDAAVQTAVNAANGALDAACVTERVGRSVLRKVVPVVVNATSQVAYVATNVVVPALVDAYNASRSDVAQRDEAVELMSIGVSRVVGVQVADDDDIDCVLVTTPMWDLINDCLVDPTAPQDLSETIWVVPAVLNPKTWKYECPGPAALASFDCVLP